MSDDWSVFMTSAVANVVATRSFGYSLYSKVVAVVIRSAAATTRRRRSQSNEDGWTTWHGAWVVVLDGYTATTHDVLSMSPRRVLTVDTTTDRDAAACPPPNRAHLP